jgi:hypothetical protein
MLIQNLLYLISGVLIFTLGYGLCYYSHIRKAKASVPVRTVPIQKPHFVVPDNKNQLQEQVTHKPMRPGKKENKE